MDLQPTPLNLEHLPAIECRLARPFNLSRFHELPADGVETFIFSQ